MRSSVVGILQHTSGYICTIALCSFAEGTGVAKVPKHLRGKASVLFHKICHPSSGDVAVETFQQLEDLMELLQKAKVPGDPFQNFILCW